MDVASMDNEEIVLLCLSLQCAGAQSPLLDIGWLDGFAYGFISVEDVLDAAMDVLSLSEDG